MRKALAVPHAGDEPMGMKKMHSRMQLKDFIGRPPDLA
jgi:hypothetical protein